MVKVLACMCILLTLSLPACQRQTEAQQDIPTNQQKGVKLIDYNLKLAKKQIDLTSINSRQKVTFKNLDKGIVIYAYPQGNLRYCLEGQYNNIIRSTHSDNDVITSDKCVQ